jgi:mannose-6-phosphate isomerase-like protein (cupin superfamily)
VFERVKPGEWYDRGEHGVTGSTYRFLEGEGRMVYEFVLEPVG